MTEDKLSTFRDRRVKSDEDGTSYEYDGNIFRTYKAIRDEKVRADLDYYLNYDGDEKPTDEMVEYANSAVDAYTAMLIEEGIV